MKRILLVLLFFCAGVSPVCSGSMRTVARWGGGGAAGIAAAVAIAAQLKINAFKSHPYRWAAARESGELRRLYGVRNRALGIMGLGGSFFAGSLLGAKQEPEAPGKMLDTAVPVTAASDPGAVVEAVVVSLPDSVEVPAKPLVPSQPSAEEAPAVEQAPAEQKAVVEGAPAEQAAPTAAISDPAEHVDAQGPRDVGPAPLAAAVVQQAAPREAPKDEKKPVVTPVQSRSVAQKLSKLAKPGVAPLVVQYGNELVSELRDGKVRGIFPAVINHGVRGTFSDEVAVRSFLAKADVNSSKGVAFFKQGAQESFIDATVAASVVKEIEALVAAAMQEGHDDDNNGMNFAERLSLSARDVVSVFSPVTIPGDGHCAAHCYVFFRSGLSSFKPAPYYFMATFDALVEARRMIFAQRQKELSKADLSSSRIAELGRTVGMGRWVAGKKKGKRKTTERPQWVPQMKRLQQNTALAAPADSDYYLGEEDILCMARMLGRPLLLWTGNDAEGYRIVQYAGLSSGSWANGSQDLSSCYHVLFTQGGTGLAIGGRGHWSVLVPKSIDVQR